MRLLHWIAVGSTSLLIVSVVGLIDVKQRLEGSGLTSLTFRMVAQSATRKRRSKFNLRFVESSLAEQSQEESYRAGEGRLLGSEEVLKEDTGLETTVRCGGYPSTQALKIC
jgi:hypothetical protein